MSHAGKDIKFSLKVMVNKKKGKVLFAEVDSSFADVLLSFLTLPLGTIVRILKKHYGDDAPAFGSLSTLYNGLANLDSDHFWTEGAKSILLHPRSSSDAECKKLGLDISDSPPFEYFVCSKECYKLRLRSISMFYDITGKCNSCKGNLIKEVVDNNDAQIVACEDGVFTKTTVSFLITDDLHIMPNAGLSQIVSVLGITDMDEAETILITFGFPNVMDLLKASLTSPTPLSDLIFKKTTKMSSTKRIYEDGTSSISNSKTMNLKLMVQKSTNKLLYAEAEEDFVEFLFSFLIIPLGGVVSLLSRNSNLKPIDSLYKSAADLIHDKYFKNPDAKNRLIKPSIPHGYLSENHILPLTKECLLLAPYNIFSCGWRSSTRFPNGQGSYLKGPRTYKIADDLTVTPFCIISILSGLKDQKIPVSDVKEVMLQIGLKEALSILKASLTSTTALSDALLSQVVKEPSKREV
ncbi:uncharacterized protein LOC131010001 [Salvia miltiorrhiza]|uniref:uncharacterized protein LOC131010001 n=1 Tax=Salvia miltiorrhiza TaxID=226208 RepID=UPI0025ACEEEA|nr:uncharacterized protein LOC131010001 [Salvia miltiorrhiza]